MPVTSIFRMLAVASLFMFAGAGAGVAGGADHRGHQGPAHREGPAHYQGSAHWEGPAHWEKFSLEFRTCGLGERLSPIDVRYVSPLTKLSPCSFNYNFIPRKNLTDWNTTPVAYGFGGVVGGVVGGVGGGGAIAVDGKTRTLIETGLAPGSSK